MSAVEASRLFHQTFHLQRETTQQHAAPGDSKLPQLRGFAARRRTPDHLAKVDGDGAEPFSRSKRWPFYRKRAEKRGVRNGRKAVSARARGGQVPPCWYTTPAPSAPWC